VTFNLEFIKLKFVYTMKKIFALLAIASMVAVACGKDDNDTNPDEKKAQTIEIDGDFSDWAALDADNVAVCYNAGEDAIYSALTEAKVYATAQYVYIYFKIDKDQIDMEDIPCHIYINGDNNETTGGYSDEFAVGCSDVLLEGHIAQGGAFISYDPGASKWSNPDVSEGWEWEEIVAEGSGLCTGAGKGNEYEIAFTREMYPLGVLADEFTIGFDIQVINGDSWDSVGVLPNEIPTEDNTSGRAPMLKVTTIK